MTEQVEDTIMTTLAPTGFFTIGAAELEYRMIGPAPADAPTIVMLHEGLGSAGLWGDFPEILQASTGAGVFAKVSFIQRLDTTGGAAPAGPCSFCIPP